MDYMDKVLLDYTEQLQQNSHDELRKIKYMLEKLIFFKMYTIYPQSFTTSLTDTTSIGIRSVMLVPAWILLSIGLVRKSV